MTINFILAIWKVAVNNKGYSVGFIISDIINDTVIRIYLLTRPFLELSLKLVF